MTVPETIGEALAHGRRLLAQAGIDSAGLDGRLLMEAAAGVTTAELVGHPERPLDDRVRDRFGHLIARRRAHEPIAQIVGLRDFWKASFAVSRDVLTPRPESETLVEAAIDYFRGRPAPGRILDLGTGSGCLLASLLSEFPDSRGLGVDLNPAAARIAAANLARLGLGDRGLAVCADWTAAAAGTFELIVCNPPYVTEAEFSGLPPEVREFEPASALLAGADGLSAFRRLLPSVPGLLAAGGLFAMEIGAGQAEHVKLLMAGEKFTDMEIRRDLAGIERCILATVADS